MTLRPSIFALALSLLALPAFAVMTDEEARAVVEDGVARNMPSMWILDKLMQDGRSLEEATAIAVAANISSKDELQHLVDETTAAFGDIHILVCNAASNPYYGPMAEIDDDRFQKILTSIAMRQSRAFGTCSESSPAEACPRNQSKR